MKKANRSKSPPRSELKKGVTAVLLSAVVAAVLASRHRGEIPAHLSNHPVRVVPNLIPNETSVDLMALMKEFGEFASNVDQSKAQGFKPKYEDIGASQEITPDGRCSHKFLFPNAEKTKCVLPQRVDIGKHFISTGGFDGSKELYSDLVDRVSSFGRYTFIEEIEKYQPVKTLFESQRFQDAAKSVCPMDRQFLDPFQFNFIVQVPGQTVAMHIDSPYFWGASRFSFPQWFLVAMVFSNLFMDKFVHQVQVRTSFGLFLFSFNQLARSPKSTRVYSWSTPLVAVYPGHTDVQDDSPLSGQRTTNCGSLPRGLPF